ncbi:MAG: hypothetical protein Q9219_007129 [cf. Caloplaca sp. 3 TL-2023]
MLFPSQVCIVLFLLTLTNCLPNSIAVRNEPTNPPNDTLQDPSTFRLILAAAVRRVRRDYPIARLHRIECTSPRGPIRDPRRMTDIRLFFALPGSAHFPALMLPSKPRASAWGQWAPIEFLLDARPPSELGLGDILTSDILPVVATMRQAGQYALFESIDIVKEVGMTEVWWQFQMRGQGADWVWVGDESGTVEVEEGKEDRPGVAAE